MKYLALILIPMLVLTADVRAEKKKSADDPEAVQKESAEAPAGTAAEAVPMKADVPSLENLPEMKTAAKREWEIQAGGQYVLPLGEGWTGGPGLEAGFRRWRNESWGWGASVGYTTWSYSQDPLDVDYTDLTPLRAEGDTTLIPLSLLACYRKDLEKRRFDLAAHAGLRYVIVDSEIEVKVAYEDHYGRAVHYETFVENNSHVMGFAGAELRGDLPNSFLWSAGAEIQVDLLAPDENWLRENVGNDFNAVIFRAGIGRTF